MKIIGTIEARMGSTRLPGKTLMEVYDGKCLLELVVRRFQMATRLDDIFIATSVKKADDPIVDWCEQNSIKYYRGSEDDVLGRVVNTALTAKADAIVQMGADSAYLDYKIIVELIDIYCSGEYDYVCNDTPLSYPLGIYGHIVSVQALVDLNARTDLTAKDREDVVRLIFEHPEKYRIKNITAPEQYAFPQLRFTIDYPEDMVQAQEIYRRFDRIDFTLDDLLGLYRQEPTLFEETMKLAQKWLAHNKRK
jgi:spore coat polysaccharide biosynthesis protein SpsF